MYAVVVRDVVIMVCDPRNLATEEGAEEALPAGIATVRRVDCAQKLRVDIKVWLQHQHSALQLVLCILEAQARRCTVSLRQDVPVRDGLGEQLSDGVRANDDNVAVEQHDALVLNEREGHDLGRVIWTR